MTLWSFAVSLYGRPGVERTCLTLQDEDGQCVALLLWRLWALDRALDDRLLDELVDLARHWETAVLTPLRRARHGLREPFPGMADAARLALREAVKADGLMAERVLLESLETLSPPEAVAPADALGALRDLAVRWGGRSDDARLARLAAAAASATA